MPTNNEIREKLYQETLDEIARSYPPIDTIDGRKGIKFNLWNEYLEFFKGGDGWFIQNAVKLAIDKTEPAARAEGYKEGQRDAANKIFKELDKQVEIGRLRIGKNAIATCGIIKVYRGSAYVESRKKWLG